MLEHSTLKVIYVCNLTETWKLCTSDSHSTLRENRFTNWFFNFQHNKAPQYCYYRLKQNFVTETRSNTCSRYRLFHRTKRKRKTKHTAQRANRPTTTSTRSAAHYPRFNRYIIWLHGPCSLKTRLSETDTTAKRMTALDLSILGNRFVENYLCWSHFWAFI